MRGIAPNVPDVISLGNDFRSVEDVTNEIFDLWKLARPGGASKRGWSSRQTLQRCPYLFWAMYRKGLKNAGGSVPLPLEVGSLYHMFQALDSITLGEIMSLDGVFVNEDGSEYTEALTPQIFRDEALARGVNPEAIMESWRVFEAYRLHYDADYLRPLAVEALGEVGEDTCRWDLIAAVDDAQSGVIPGTYIVERKTMARFDATAMESWKNDGEVIGQIRIYQKGDYAEKWGPLQGVIVDIAGKQKIPRFERIIIPPQAWQVEQHANDLRVWSGLEHLFTVTDTWPRSRANCVTKYGACALFNHCSDGTELPTRETEE